MKSWATCTVDELRAGNVFKFDEEIVELRGKRPSGRGGNECVFLDVIGHGPIETWRQATVEVYR